MNKDFDFLQEGLYDNFFERFCYFNLNNSTNKLQLLVIDLTIDFYRRHYKKFKQLRKRRFSKFEINYELLEYALGKARKSFIKYDVRTEANKVVKRLRGSLLIEYNYSCAYCGSSENLHIDHIFPISKGGSIYRENLQVLCRSCNCKKSNKIVDNQSKLLSI